MRGCGREQEVLRALRTGARTEELGSHVQGCAACSETERVAQALLASAESVRDGLQLPGAEIVWRRAQARAREAALRRATRPLRAMLALSFVSLAVAGAWVAGQIQGAVAGDFQAMGGWGWLMAGVTVSVNWIAVLLSLIVAGSWCLWYIGRRTPDAGNYRTAS